MNAIIVFLANIIFLIYCVLFFVDHAFFPKETGLKIRNGLFIFMALYLGYNVLNIYILKKQKPENGIVYKIASASKKYLTAAYLYIKPFQKELLTWTLVAVGISVIGLFTLGISGYVFLYIPAKLGIVNEIQGDNAWPAAIFMSMFWSIFLPIGVVVKHFLIRNGYPALATFGWIGVVAGGIIGMITLTYLMFGKSEA